MTTNIVFLDTLVTREPDGKLHTSVYRKPTHTDQYLAYDSHHPQSVKRGIVKCLHDRAKRIITKPSGTAQEKKHLSTVLVANGYPSPLLQKVTETRNPALGRKTAEFKSTAVLPYIKGVVFKSDSTLRSRLIRPKDLAPKQARWRSLQDTMRMRQSLHRRNGTTHAKKNERTRQGYTTRTHSEFRGFRTC